MTEEKPQGNLELQWINKDKSLMYEIDEDEGRGIKPTWVDKNDIRVSEPRILKMMEEYGDPDNENMLIKGDNLLALRALVEYFRDKVENEKVKCIYIDPPFDIGAAFEHYDDNLEQSQWLTMMRDRLILLKRLLKYNGIICVHIDDTEAHYLKLLLDDVFGRNNFLTTIYLKSVYEKKTLKQDRIFHDIIQQILIYKNVTIPDVNQEFEEYTFDKFCWYVAEKGHPTKTLELGGKKVEIFSNNTYTIEEGTPSKVALKEIWASGTILDINSSGRFFRDYLTNRVHEDGLGTLYKVYGIGDDNLPYRYFTGPKRKGATKGKYYQGVPINKLDESANNSKKISIENFWDMAADFGNCRHEGGVELKSGKKPEKLLMKIIKYFSEEGDLILDSFLGSGTTAAVAHKMKRKWIGIEIGKQAETHCVVRMNNVISGKDKTGISKEENWKGGGGFRYYMVGNSVLSAEDMNWELTFEELAEAVLMNFGFNVRKDPLFKGVFVGESRKKGRFALCTVTKKIDIVREEELMGWLKALAEKHGEWTEVEIYTNKGMGIRSDVLPEGVVLKKIPESLLAKYNL